MIIMLMQVLWYNKYMRDNTTTYAFIDSQNLYKGVGGDIVNPKTEKVEYEGWELDYRKFRLYLKNKYGVSKAYFFIGNLPGKESFYTLLQDMGYTVVLKPTLPFRENGVSNVKGNVDAELVLYASALTYNQYDKAIIVSGDGDFLCLAEYLDAQNKLLKILTPNPKYSSLLNKFAPRILIVGSMRQQLERNKKTGLAGRSKP